MDDPFLSCAASRERGRQRVWVRSRRRHGAGGRVIALGDQVRAPLRRDAAQRGVIIEGLRLKLIGDVECAGSSVQQTEAAAYLPNGRQRGDAENRAEWIGDN